MVRIRVLDVDGDAADVQAVLAQLRGVMPAAGDGSRSGGAPVLELPAGSVGEAEAPSARRSGRRRDGPTRAGQGRAQATRRPDPRSDRRSPAPRRRGATDIEEVSTEEDAGVRFDGDQIHIYRKGRGRHMHEFVLPDSATAPGAGPHSATCGRQLAGKPCPETRTFALR